MVFTWARKRQILFLGILIIIIGGLGFAVVSPYVNSLPSCQDYRQNGDETGVDCGGSCPSACLYQVDQVSILWARAFKVVPGRYNAVVYLENHNPRSAIKKIHYSFRFADENNIYIGKRDGETLIPASGKFAIFEPAIDFGNSIPVYTTFQFTETPAWLQVPEERMNELNVAVFDIKLVDEMTKPRLSATIKNDSLFIIQDINIVAVLYNNKGNAVTASSTYLKQLGRQESADVNFTWPEPFTDTIVTKEIIPMYDIFSVKLK